MDLFRFCDGCLRAVYATLQVLFRITGCVIERETNSPIHGDSSTLAWHAFFSGDACPVVGFMQKPVCVFAFFAG